MLFLHETHKVVGAREDEFEAAYREGWMPTLADGGQRSAALVRQPRSRLRGFLQRRHHHRRSPTAPPGKRLARRSADRRSQPVDARAGPPAPRRDRQAPAAGRLVAAADGRSGDGAHRWRDPSAEPVHGGHRLARRSRSTTTSGCGTRSTTDCFPKRRQEMRILDIQACFQVAHGSYRTARSHAVAED